MGPSLLLSRSRHLCQCLILPRIFPGLSFVLSLDARGHILNVLSQSLYTPFSWGFLCPLCSTPNSRYGPLPYTSPKRWTAHSEELISLNLRRTSAKTFGGYPPACRLHLRVPCILWETYPQAMASFPTTLLSSLLIQLTSTIYVPARTSFDFFFMPGTPTQTSYTLVLSSC